MPENPAPAPSAPQPVVYRQFAGLRNTTDPERLEPKDLSIAINVDLDDTGKLSLRPGQSRVLAHEAVHSLWADADVCLFVAGDALMRLQPDLSATVLASGLEAGARVAYWPVLDRVFWSNGHQSGCVQAGRSRSWGLPVAPLASAVVRDGALPPGRYQHAMTWKREDGQESGCGLAGQLDLATPGAVEWPALPPCPDPDVTHRALYLSRCNSETLYRVAVLPVSATSALYRGDGLGLVLPLATQFAGPAPLGQAIANYRGVMFVAAGDTLYHSDPHAPELFRMATGFMPIGSYVHVVAPVADGIFVGTEREIVFLAGMDPGSFTLRQVAPFGAIPGTLAYVDGAQFGAEGVLGKVALFATAHGLCAGLDGGQLIPVSAPRYRIARAGVRGAVLWRESPGKNQLIVALEG
jgi:hypothetical protein